LHYLSAFLTNLGQKSGTGDEVNDVRGLMADGRGLDYSLSISSNAEVLLNNFLLIICIS